MRVTKESSISGNNIPYPIIDPFGKRLTRWYDWSSFLSQFFIPIPSITKYHYFAVSHENLSKIMCKEFIDSPEIQIMIVSQAKREVPNTLPPVITPEGLDLT